MERVCVVFLPSPVQAEWRLAFVQMAQAEGWSSYEQGQDVPSRSQQRTNIFINCFDADVAETYEPTVSVVVTESPDRALSAAMAEFGLDYEAALALTSMRFAKAAVLVENGAAVASATDPRIEIDGLGWVEQTRVCDGSLADASPIAFFSKLPLMPGTSATWPLALFHHATVDSGRPIRTPCHDLTGRARPLLFGPYLPLPPGRWRTTVRFALYHASAPVHLRFEWGGGAASSTEQYVLTEPGKYEISLEEHWPTVSPAELRIYLERAIFDGEFIVESCAVYYCGRLTNE